MYTVKEGRQAGIFRSWLEAQAQTDHHPGSMHIRASSPEAARQFTLAYLAKVRRSRAGYCRISLQDHLNQLLIDDQVRSKRGRKALRHLIELCEDAVPADGLVLVCFPFAAETYRQETQHHRLKMRHISK